MKCGCFNGTLEEFTAAVGKRHEDSRHAKAYLAAIKLAALQISLSGNGG